MPYTSIKIFLLSDINTSLMSSKLKLNRSSGTQLQLLLSLDGAPLVTMVTGTRNTYADSMRGEHCNDISQAREITALSPICSVMPAAFMSESCLESAFNDSFKTWLVKCHVKFHDSVGITALNVRLHFSLIARMRIAARAQAFLRNDFLSLR